MEILDAARCDCYYDALVEKDPTYLGIFYAGVTSTGIFCISTCTARKPRRDRVRFFDGMKDAMAAGFRPCKVCKPTEHAHEAPAEVEAAIDWIRQHPERKLSDSMMREMHLSSSAIRRWFKKHYKMTFQAYQRMYRINSAMNSLTLGGKTVDTAFESGYESLSGFGYTFQKLTGKAPSRARRDGIILIDRFTTVLGPMFVCATDRGVCLLEFTDRRMLETEFHELQQRFRARILAGTNEHIEAAKSQIAEYFDGSRTVFDLALDAPGTDFQRSVWEVLQTIPYGETRSYQDQAVALENPSAVRAVASANGKNRISIIIPCHRVIGKDGSLTGYGGGLERKRWLLEHEARIRLETQGLEHAGSTH